MKNRFQNVRRFRPDMNCIFSEACVGDIENTLLARLIALEEQLTSRCTRWAQLAPIARLPNEILLNIFRQGAGGPPATKNSIPFELAVSGVCRVWRGLALSIPQFWTDVFITSKTPPNHLPTYMKYSSNLPLAVSFCHWPSVKRDRIHMSSEAFLVHILDILYFNAGRLRSLRVWNVSDTALLTILSELIDASAPALTEVSIKGSPTVYWAFYKDRGTFDFPFLIDNDAPSLSLLEIDHFPIVTTSMPFGWAFSLRSLRSLTMRTDDLCRFRRLARPALPFLIDATDLRLLLQSINGLEYLALHGPVVDFTENTVQNESVSAPALRTLIIHCETSCYRYHRGLLSILHAPCLEHLVLPWHDNLQYEVGGEDLTGCFFRGNQDHEHGEPKFPLVKRLRLHDSTVKRMLPAESFVRAFPNVEEVVLGGMDIVGVALALEGLVMHGAENGGCGTLARGAWVRVKSILVDGLTAKSWRRCAGPLRRWMRAGGHECPVVVIPSFCPDEIVERAPMGCKDSKVDAEVLQILLTGSLIGSAYKLAMDTGTYYFY